VEFVAGEADSTAALLDSLRVSELMYDPVGGSDFEFIELHNVGLSSLDLSGAKFTQGIDFTFPPGTVIAPGGFLLVVPGTNSDNFTAFRASYGLAPSVPMVGPFEGKLDNNGETITLKAPAGTEARGCSGASIAA
jgi:hypothetical protein